MLSCKLQFLSVTLISVYTTGWLTTVQAQDLSTADGSTTTLDPVTITASKRDQALDKLNGAASVADRFDLEDAQVASTLELDRVFPELYMSHSATFMFPIDKA